MPYCSVNGIRIYYDVSGEGFPMVFIHANPFDHRLWIYQIARFSTFFKVIRRGYFEDTGARTRPVTETTVAEMAEDIVGVCRQEQVSEAILCGISVGRKPGTSNGIEPSRSLPGVNYGWV